MAHKEQLITWVKDAHSLDTALIPVLENHAKDAKHHSDVQAREHGA